MKYLLIVLAFFIVAIGAYGYSASQKNKALAAQTAAYNAQKEAKANAEEARQAALKQKVESQQQAWGKKSSEQLAAEQAQENKERTVTSIKTDRSETVEFLEKCQKLIKLNSSYPSTVDFSVFSSKVTKAQSTGNTAVIIPFTAKGGTGVELPFTGRCVFSPDGQGEVSIVNR